MSDNRKRKFVVRLSPEIAERVKAHAGRNDVSNNEAVEQLIDAADALRGELAKAARCEMTLRGEIERLTAEVANGRAPTRAIESNDAIAAVQAFAREKAIPENEAADALLLLGWRRHKALQKHREKS